MFVTSDSLNVVDSIVREKTYLDELNKYIKLKSDYSNLANRGTIEWVSRSSKHKYYTHNGEIGLLIDIGRTLRDNY